MTLAIITKLSRLISYKQLGKIARILIHTLMILGLIHLGACSPPSLQQNELVDLIIADLVHDNDYLIYNTLGSTQGSADISRIPIEEIEILRQMLNSNYAAEIVYENDKATVFMDLSNTGIIEWLNINKLDVPPTTHFEEKRYRILYMQYSNGRWFNCRIWSLNQEPLDGWPTIPEFLEKRGERMRGDTS